nr:MAG TPA: hypothetical protein [Caudoviricetes sp.]
MAPCAARRPLPSTWVAAACFVSSEGLSAPRRSAWAALCPATLRAGLRPSLFVDISGSG